MDLFSQFEKRNDNCCFSNSLRTKNYRRGAQPKFRTICNMEINRKNTENTIRY